MTELRPISAGFQQRLSRDLEDLTSRSGNMTYAQACNRNAEELPDRIAVVDRRNRLDWAAVKERSDRLALGLMECGILRPDVAMLHLPNGAEQFLIRLACEKAGIRVALTSTWFRETELISIIEQTRPRIAFIDTDLAGGGAYDRLREIMADRNMEIQFVSVGVGAGAPWAESWDKFYQRSPTGPADGLLDRTRFGFDERFYLATTSGSTSAPKITDVIFGNRIWLSLMHAAGAQLGVGGTLAALPPITSGTSDSLVHHAAPYFAAKIVLETHFDAVATTEFLIAEDVQVATAVPTMLARLVASGAVDRLHDSPLNCFAVYASALSYELAVAVEERGRCNTIRCYGTMDYGGISMSTLDDGRDRRIRSVGMPFFDNDVKIIDQNGGSVPAGIEGEVAIRPGRYSMGGYYRNPKLTADAWSGDYYRLGDLAVMDEDGYITLVGRAKELIIRGGQNIVPSEVEELITAHEAVVDVVVIGLSDDEMGERACACIIVAEGAALSLDDLRAHFNQLGVARFKCPERIALFDEFPMTMSGIKVDRRELTELVLADRKI
jgi:non-ribosomal peptide synthetase component E (peptide arylation enzyme)